MRKAARIVYDRSYGLPGHIVLRGQSSDMKLANELSIELVILSKFIWGRGASANSIFNTGSIMIKFQADAETNSRRARTLAWAWRLAKAQGIDIHKLPTYSSQKAAAEDGMFTEDRYTISSRLSKFIS